MEVVREEEHESRATTLKVSRMAKQEKSNPVEERSQKENFQVDSLVNEYFRIKENG